MDVKQNNSRVEIPEVGVQLPEWLVPLHLQAMNDSKSCTSVEKRLHTLPPHPTFQVDDDDVELNVLGCRLTY